MPIVIKGINYGAPIENLKIAMKDAGLESVDLWIGTGGAADCAARASRCCRPKAYIPIHWDGLWEPFEGGMPWPFSDAALEDYLAKSGVNCSSPASTWTSGGWTMPASTRWRTAAIKNALGFSGIQSFPGK